MRPEDLGAQYVERQQRKVRFVAGHMAMCDGNAGVGQFDHMPEGVRDDYLADAAKAVEGCDLFDAQNPFPPAK